jgi:hypothetical protein
MVGVNMCLLSLSWCKNSRAQTRNSGALYMYYGMWDHVQELTSA